MMNTVLRSLILALFIGGAVAQDWAIEKLNRSPRHHEWVSISQGDRKVEAFVAYPEAEGKTPAIVVIHENRGLSDWVRVVADDLAASGYLAIAPDLLSGHGPNGGKTSDFSDSDAARQAIYQLPPAQVTADLNAVVAYVSKLPASTGTVAVGGFCWGGSQTFRFAASGANIAAAYVFYGTGPDEPEAIARVTCPVYGFYGGNDARVNATLTQSSQLMTDAGKSFDPVIYPGAGHGFMRSGEAPDAEAANREARSQAWQRWKGLLRQLQPE